MVQQQWKPGFSASDSVHFAIGHIQGCMLSLLLFNIQLLLDSLKKNDLTSSGHHFAILWFEKMLTSLLSICCWYWNCYQTNVLYPGWDRVKWTATRWKRAKTWVDSGSDVIRKGEGRDYNVWLSPNSSKSPIKNKPLQNLGGGDFCNFGRPNNIHGCKEPGSIWNLIQAETGASPGGCAAFI